jgi:hypothetical protein
MLITAIIAPLVWVLGAWGVAKGAEPQTKLEWLQVCLWPLYAMWLIGQAVYYSLKGF